jgi:hypothetical protein
MIIEITRNIILDLLPMYLANEVSEDTKDLIEKYLETDRELANMVKHSTEMGLPKDIPIPLTRDDNLRAFKRAKRRILLRTVILAAVTIFIMAIILYMFFVPAE